MIRADLSGKRAIVTGASSGLGLSMAKCLARNGAHVTVVARRKENLEALVAELKAEGLSADYVAADLSDKAAIRALFEGPAPDILVNNAGVAGKNRALDCDDEEWRWTFDINLDAVFVAAQAAAKAMVREGKGGSIINIASITGHRPGPGAAAYAASKAAVLQITRATAMEWARHGVRVNSISPGYIETDINREFLQSKFGEDMRKRIPQRRFGLEAELNGALLLLASDASTYMTGSDIVVDGGHLVSPL